jgi:hypothetical protein
MSSATAGLSIVPILPDIALETTRLFQSFTQDLVLDALVEIVASLEFEELAIELGAALKIRPQLAGNLLHRVIVESRKRVWGISI